MWGTLVRGIQSFLRIMEKQAECAHYVLNKGMFYVYFLQL